MKLLEAYLSEAPAAFICLGCTVLAALAESPSQTNQAVREQYWRGPQQYRERAVSQVTNRICSVLSARWYPGQLGTAEVDISIWHVNESVSNLHSGMYWFEVCDTNHTMRFFGEEKPLHYTNNPPLGVFQELGTFFQALNSFCGPIELRDANGLALPLLRPEVNRLEFYPEVFKFNALQPAKFGISSNSVWSGPPWPTYLRTVCPQLCRFAVKDYFAIKKPGDYRLTVWPKIYKRSADDAMVCRRVDLPPVSLMLKWDTSSPHR